MIIDQSFSVICSYYNAIYSNKFRIFRLGNDGSDKIHRFIERNKHFVKCDHFNKERRSLRLEILQKNLDRFLC